MTKNSRKRGLFFFIFFPICVVSKSLLLFYSSFFSLSLPVDSLHKFVYCFFTRIIFS